MIKSEKRTFGKAKAGRRKSLFREPGSPRVRDLEDRIERKLASYAAIRHLDLEWSSAVRWGTAEFDLKKAKRFQSLYEDWFAGTMGMIVEMKKYESRGILVMRSQEFREAVGYCPAGIDIEEVIRNFERLEKGEGVVVHEGSVNGKLPGRRRP
jgi:hypothetical protein